MFLESVSIKSDKNRHSQLKSLYDIGCKKCIPALLELDGHILNFGNKLSTFVLQMLEH